MTAAHLLATALVLGAALLASEVVLKALRLHQCRVGSGTWVVGVVALALATQWARAHTDLSPDRIHLGALVVAGLLTCLWFNDHRSVPVRNLSERAQEYAARERARAGSATAGSR